MDIRDFIKQFSVPSLLNQAAAEVNTPPQQSGGFAVPDEPLMLSPEYLSKRDPMDDLALEARGIMNKLQPGTSSRAQPVQHNAGLKSFVPQNVNFKGPMPVLGLNTSVDQVVGWLGSKESGNNYSALNKEKKGNTASGRFQYTDATWNGYGGYSKAMYAPPAVQERRIREDMAKRARMYNGDVFKAIAHHYLPAAAGNPRNWTQPYKLGENNYAAPVANYVAYVVRGTPLEPAFHAYLRGIQ